jgi:hypothetical protein
MICTHGQLDESVCPECSMLHNVKPLARASNAAFIEMGIRHTTPAPAASDTVGERSALAGREIPTTTLRITRTPVDDRHDTLMPGNSGNLHARLKQVLGRGFEVGMLDEGVERRIKLIQKRETNPRAKLE